jgi:uncharacterized membrane protein YbaN (DUF454 family)
LKALFISLAILSLGIGILGIVIPGLPTTPFLLLSAWLLAKSSHKLHHWLLNHRVFGQMIKNYYDTKSLTIYTKISSISLMWLMISLSSIYWIDNLYLRILLIILGITGTIVMGFLIKTRK